MAGGVAAHAAAAAAAWELAVLFVLRPLLALSFVLSIVALNTASAAAAAALRSCWYVAWRTVLVHVPVVQEIAGLRRKKPVKPKPKNRGRFVDFYRSLAESERNNRSEGTS